MKTAFLIYAHNKPKHLQRLLNALNSPNHYFFIHIDKKADLNKFSFPKLNNVHILKERINVNWGGFSQVAVTISLLKHALEQEPFDYFTLLSGSDFPIRSNDKFDEYLKTSDNSEFINICRMPLNGKSLDRVKNFYIEYDTTQMSVNNIIKRSINAFFKYVFIKRNLPKEYKKFELYGGSSWWILTKSAINYIFDFVNDNPKFLTFYQNTLCPDEMFFHTILGNSNFISKMKPALFYSDFSKGGAHPVSINREHLELFDKPLIETSYGKTKIFFARKFEETSDLLINQINMRFRK